LQNNLPGAIALLFKTLLASQLIFTPFVDRAFFFQFHPAPKTNITLYLVYLLLKLFI